MKNMIQRVAMKFGYSIHRSDVVHTLRFRAQTAEGNAEAARAEAALLRTERDVALDQRDELRRTVSSRECVAPVMTQYEHLQMAGSAHAAGAFPTDVLKRIEEILPSSVESSAETGCGKSTILFSNISKRHKVFALDDTSWDDSSVTFFRDCQLTKNERIETIFGPTQKTLPGYEDHLKYDVVLIDGPHGYPFPEIEYLAFYPHIKHGGYLIVDDVCIPTIARLADFIAEDEMFELVETVNSTSIFRRTDAPSFDPTADGWWTQRYNRRRVSTKREIFLHDGEVVDRITSQKIDDKIHGA